MPLDIHFLRPLWFLALLPLPWLLWRLGRANTGTEAWRGLVDAHLLRHLLVDEDARVRRLPRVLLALGWLLGVTALAGPVWERLPQPLYQAQAQRVIVLDLSSDMDAQDLAPSRLARARFEVLDLLAAAAEGQTALLAYGAEPFVVAPLTSDAATIAAQVPDLETALLPVQGPKRTDLALEEAGNMLKRSGSPEGDIILVTADAERLEAVRSLVARLHDQGYRTSVLGLGTAKGAPVPLADGGFQTDAQGAIRLTRLRPDLLQDIADAGGGRYVPLAADDSDTRALLPEAGRNAGGREVEEMDAQADQWREEGPWLLLGLLPLAALAFRRGWLSPLILLVLFLPPPTAEALSWEDLWWRTDQQGALALAAGDPRQAAARFNRPDWRAAAQYQSGDYDQALETLQDQAGAEAAYNRGNALARAGKLPEAIEEYDRTLGEAPGHADAQHNRDLLQRLLDQQQPPSQTASSASQTGESSQDGQEDADSQDQQGQTGDYDARDQQGRQVGQSESQDTGGQGQNSQQGQSGSQDPDPDPAGTPPRQASSEQPGEPQKGESGQGDGQEGDEAQEGPQAGRSRSNQSEPQAGEESQEDAAAGARPREAGAEPAGQTTDKTPQAGPEPGKQDLIGGQEPGRPPAGEPEPEIPTPMSEGEQAMEHQLRRVPDDPGGLLRQRFLLQHLRRQGQLP